MRLFSFPNVLRGTCVMSCLMAAPAVAWTALEIGVVAGLRTVVVESGVDSGVDSRVDSGQVKILGGETTHAVQFENGEPRLVPAAAPPSPVVPSDMIPHASVTQGKQNIAAAWLATATDRYNHGVLGDEIEAAAVAVRLRDGGVLRYDLPADSVFEDLTPRLYDMDRDGDDEIILVRSDLYGGAAVSILTVGAAGLEIFAEAYPIGLAHRWLNPVGAADFDGDGVTDVAAVVTPHLRGVLSFYKPEGQRLERFAAAPGFSTHYIGSTILGMSVILDANNDGRPDIILPSLDRTTLYAVGFNDARKLEIIETVRHDSEITTAIVAADIDGQGDLDIVYGLDNGAIVLIRR